MTAVGYISDTKKIIVASWSVFQYGGEAAFTFSERSPLPSALSTNDLPGGRTHVSNVHQMSGIYRHPVESDNNSVTESISDTVNWTD